MRSTIFKSYMSIGVLTDRDLREESASRQPSFNEVMHTLRDLPAEFAASIDQCLRSALGDKATDFILMREKERGNKTKNKKKTQEAATGNMSNRARKRLNRQAGKTVAHMSKKK